MRRGAATTKKRSKAESDALAKAVAAAQALLASLVALTEAAPAKSGNKIASKGQKVARRKKRQEAKKGIESTKAEEEEKSVDAPKAVATESIELEDGWEKVPQKKKRIQTWNVRSADWEKFAEGINDSNRAAISVVIQVEDGDAWLELRSLVASAESDGKPPPRVTAVMPWTGDQQEEASIRQMTGGELKKVPGVCGTWKILFKQVWVTMMQRSRGPQFSQIPDGGAKNLPDDGGQIEGRQKVCQRANLASHRAKKDLQRLPPKL